MLVLSRKVNETIVLGGGEIEVMVTHISPTRVRLAIKAPAGTAIHRGEVQAALDRDGTEFKRKHERPEGSSYANGDG